MSDESYVDLLEALKWGATLELTDNQRESLAALAIGLLGRSRQFRLGGLSKRLRPSGRL